MTNLVACVQTRSYSLGMKTTRQAVLAHWVVRDHVRMILTMAGAAFTLVNAGRNTRRGTASVGVFCHSDSVALVEKMLRSTKPNGRIVKDFSADGGMVSLHWNL